jgi:hypothetical protein
VCDRSCECLSHTTRQDHFRPETRDWPEGANSQTFIAHDHQLDAEIVIKQIALSKLDSANQYFEESKSSI